MPLVAGGGNKNTRCRVVQGTSTLSKNGELDTSGLFVEGEFYVGVISGFNFFTVDSTVFFAHR